MVVDVDLSAGHLSLYPRVSIEADMLGSHHEMFLSATDALFERTVADVVGSLMKVGDVGKITFPDMLYLFMYIRSASISPVYQTEWVCKRQVTLKGTTVKQECDGKNKYSLQLSKIDVKKVPKTFQYPRHLVTVGTKAGPVQTEVFVRFLTVSDEFKVLDDLAEEGLSKDKMVDRAALYRLSKERLLTGLTFSDARLNEMSHEEKEAFLMESPISLTKALFEDLKVLGEFGPDFSPRAVTCTKCKGESRLAIPFSPQFILS